jgi:hypothetical protein
MTLMSTTTMLNYHQWLLWSLAQSFAQTTSPPQSSWWSATNAAESHNSQFQTQNSKSKHYSSFEFVAFFFFFFFFFFFNFSTLQNMSFASMTLAQKLSEMGFERVCGFPLPPATNAASDLSERALWASYRFLLQVQFFLFIFIV